MPRSVVMAGPIFRLREELAQFAQNQLIAGRPALNTTGRVHRRRRLGGLLNYYERAA